ncbi:MULTISPECIES: DUF2484 family protein [Marivita]|uniref:DUF2484 family protein n=1 Tax=Marivita TaxID=659428 RepID=UPI00201812C4|nr:DUF2484 family protein [Marivita sp. LZ-15-2]MCR9167950.1 DUF2484 family protein [Paracoccaceae bacterium]
MCTEPLWNTGRIIDGMVLWLSLGWVFASVMVAMLPLRSQYVPGVLLLLAAPILIVLIARAIGFGAACAALLAFGSMYRNPLRYFWTRLTRPKEEHPL